VFFKAVDMINPQVSSLSKSTTLKITALTKKLIKEGKDIVNFAAGEPDFDTPAYIKNAAIASIEEGFTKYTPSAGIPELREQIANKLRNDNNIDISGDNIIVTCGAKYALFAALLTITGANDEVIIPAPYWVSYPEMVKLTCGKIKFLPTLGQDKFKIKASALEKVITSKTKVLLLNYPNNPTGLTYTHSELSDIYDLVKNKNIYVISDEIYEILTYDGHKHASFASIGDAKKFTITVNGFSKAFSMTGWRIGYLAADREVIEEALKVIDHTTSCTSSISQRAALAALKDKKWSYGIKEEFQKRRDALWKGLSECSALEAVKPEGTFYMFCDIRKTGLTSPEFATRLLEEGLVSCIPTDSFGQEGFVRFSFATSLESIKKGIERIKAFLNKL
jgi:aspartate aminotransferase